LSRSTAGPDGTYRAEAPGEGTYVLIASADGHQPQAKTVVVGASPVTHDVLLTGSSGLAGVVRSADGGIPVAGGTGTLTATEGAPLLTLETDAEHLDRLEGRDGPSPGPLRNPRRTGRRVAARRGGGRQHPAR
jgi:hypothetical protein